MVQLDIVEPLRAESETKTSKDDQGESLCDKLATGERLRIMGSLSDPSARLNLSKWRELRLKEAPLFLILLLPILVPLFLLGWTLYYWGGRK